MKHSVNGSSQRASDDEAIEATAAAWLAQLDEGVTPEDEAAYFRWRALDARHEAAVARLEATWSALQQLRDFRPEAARHPDSDLLRSRTGRRRQFISFPGIAMAALTASFTIAVIWWMSGSRPESGAVAHRFATTVNGYERLALEDGSLLELNSASEVMVTFTSTERRVRLVRGEAHFTVARNTQRPFAVEAGSIAVRALGTAFNVRLGARDVEVLVTEGEVEVGNSEALSPPTARSVAAPTQVESVGSRLLKANERAVVPSAGTRTAPDIVVEQVAAEIVREALAWQGPRLVFVETPLMEAVAQFNRRNQIQIVLTDPELEALPIGGSFHAENVQAFVRLLEADSDIVVDRSNASRIMLRKAR